MRRGLHHDHVAVRGEHQVARFGEPGRDGAHRAVGVPAYRAVVRVRHQYRAVRQRQHAERVLEQRLGRRPVHVPEVEQPLPGGGVDRPVGDEAQRRGLAVHHPQPLAPCGQAGRLRQPGIGERAVAQRLDRGTGVAADRPLDRIEPPQLVDAGHRDDQPVVVPRQVPRRGQVGGLRVVRVPVPGGRAPRPAAAGDGDHLAVDQPYPAQQVVHRVRDDQVVPGDLGDVRRQQAQPLRLVELGDVGGPVRPARPARTDPPHHAHPVRFQLDELVPGRGGDQETGRRDDRLAGEVQVTGGYRRRHVRAGTAVQGALRAVLLDQLVEQRHQPGRMALTGHRGDQVPLRVDDAQRRPGPGGVPVPRLHPRIVEYRVPHAVPLHRGGQRVRILLVLELRRVHPDHHQHVGVPLLDRPQLVEHVQAVDAAEGPEVEQYDPAAQVGQGQRPAAGVQPAATAQFRSAYPDRGARRHPTTS